MLDFINNNGTLCTIIGSIITALIAAIVAIVIDQKKNRLDTVTSLRKEISSLKQELEQCRETLNNYKSIEKAEESISKITGSIYLETMPNGYQRHICGYCWENNHTKMPLTIASYYSENERRQVTCGDCGNCKTRCYDK